MHGTTPVGGHAPAAGGLAKASLRYVEQTDATAVQVYVSNPRGWALTEGDPGQDAAFLTGCGERGVTAYIHAALLVNLGSPTEATVERSVATLEHALRRGKAIGARGVVFHAGSAVDAAHAEKALDVVRDVLRPCSTVRPGRAGRRCWSSRAPAVAAPWRRGSSTWRRTSPPSTTTRTWASASTPATPGPPATTWPPPGA